jgi:hypothetical protein
MAEEAEEGPVEELQEIDISFDVYVNRAVESMG